MPLTNPFRRQPERPSLRERAADLRAGFARAIHRQEAELDPVAPAVSFADRIEQAAASGDVLAASGVDHRDGTVSYADAIGRVVRRPMSHWLAFNAQQMHGRVQSEIVRRSVIEANHLPDAERAAWEAGIRCELRSDAVHALAFRHVRAFEAAEAVRNGTEPATQEMRERDDAELLDLAPAWEAAVDLLQQWNEEEEAAVAAAPDRGAGSAQGQRCPPGRDQARPAGWSTG